MPDVLGHLEPAARQRAIEALVAFLASQQAPLPELKATGANPVPHEFWNKGDAAEGERLVHQVGCVACHEPSEDYEGGVKTNSAIDRLLEELDPEDIAKLGLTHAARSVASIPLPDARAKYSPQGLAMFLLEPAIVRPGGRMPNLKLNTVEAADITAYLMAKSDAARPGTASSTLPEPALSTRPGQSEEGQRLFSELGCVQCHTANGASPRAKSKPLASLNAAAERSCVAQEPAAHAPRYELDSVQRTALLAALAQERARAAPARNRASAGDRTQFAMMQLNCYACHERQGQGGIAHGRDRFFETVGQVDLGDEGRLPPPLTGVGAKLKPAWLKRVFQGTGDVRPHLIIRMPKFPAAEVDPLVALLAAADAPAANAAANKSSLNQLSAAAADRRLAEAGRTLFNLGCIQCHPVRGEALPSVVGVDVGHIGARVQPSWFHDFLLNPAALKPRTRMPTFFAEGSVSQEVLNGDVEKQIASLWAYLEQVDRLPLPEKIEEARRQNFELVPTERPIVLRTFMGQAGTHAIAVGFPERVHYAFDAELVRLAEIWRGRFLDAQGTWNDRFAPNAAPLGQSVLVLPEGGEFALLRSAQSPWPNGHAASRAGRGSAADAAASPQFLGYRLNEHGTPALQYRLGDYTITDRISPNTGESGNKEASRGLLREFTIALDARALAPATKGKAGPSDKLWFRAAAGKKLTRRSSDACTTDSGLTVYLPAELASESILRQSQGQMQWLAPLPAAAETVFTIELRW